MSDFETQEFERKLTIEAFKRSPVSMGTLINPNATNAVRVYLAYFADSMTTAELIGAYRKLIDNGHATEAEECAFLDLIAP